MNLIQRIRQWARLGLEAYVASYVLHRKLVRDIWSCSQDLSDYVVVPVGDWSVLGDIIIGSSGEHLQQETHDRRRIGKMSHLTLRQGLTDYERSILIKGQFRSLGLLRRVWRKWRRASI